MPIAMPKEEWARIVKWADENREDPETAQRRQYIQYLNDTSREMTKSWPNSLENVNKRNEEIRKARHDRAEQANLRFYRRYVKAQEQKQERLMYSARDTIFKNKDAPKMLLSAVIESVVQKERAEQVAFKAQLDKEAAEEKAAEDAEIIRKAKEWHELQGGKATKRKEVDKAHQREMFAQVEEDRGRQRREAAEELARQKEDLQRMEDEIMLLREFDEEFKAKERKRIHADNEQSLRDLEQRRRENEAKDKLNDQLLDVLARSDAAVECRRRETEKRLREEKLKNLEKITGRLKNDTAARDQHEQMVLEKAQAHKLASDIARDQAALDKKARNKAACVAAHEQFLRDEAQRQHEEVTKRNWDMMNRFKNLELYGDYKERLKDEKKKKIQDYREEIIKLWKEREDRDKREKNENKEFYGEATKKKFRDMDNKLLTHAAALLKEARDNGRPELPIHKAIDRYCKLNRLYPMPPLPKPLQLHFPHYQPFDGSEPDPGYAEPPPPPHAQCPDAAFEDDDIDDMTNMSKSGLANGLQDLFKKTGAKNPKSTKPNPAGAANGLQEVTKEKGAELTPDPPSIALQGNLLPCVSVIPYCLCEK